MKKETTKFQRLKPEDYRFNNRALNWLGRIPIYAFVPLMFLLFILTIFPINQLYGQFHERSFQTMEDMFLLKSPLLDTLGIIVFAPLIETLILQMLPFYFLNLFGFIRKHKWLVLILPSILFAIMHDYDPFNQFTIGVMGIFFMATYSLRFYKQDAFISTVLLHALLNAFSMLVNLLRLS